mmetsp:Transcript_93220/g.300074  ORF Transcript_93220/g.300074 Transcript_93220/m.300074 type:complete len:238 (+) Transcript_93220:305-1018(+)
MSFRHRRLRRPPLNCRRPRSNSGGSWAPPPTGAGCWSACWAARSARAADRSGVLVCVLGGTKCSCQETEELIRLVADALFMALPPAGVAFVTGGMPGVQQSFAGTSSSSSGSKHQHWHLVQKGTASGFGLGSDLEAGRDQVEKGQLIALVGDVYVTFEGGPGVAKEANIAFERGALVVPLVRTGGASSGMFDFPKGAIAPHAGVKDPAPWEVLGRKEASLAETAHAVAEIVAAFVRH